MLCYNTSFRTNDVTRCQHSQDFRWMLFNLFVDIRSVAVLISTRDKRKWKLIRRKRKYNLCVNIFFAETLNKKIKKTK